MKKTKNNIFKGILMLGVITLTGFVLVACGGTQLKTEDNIKEQMFAKEEFMLENVYGQDGTIDFNTSGSDDYVANSNYYVKIATEIESEIAQIKLGQVLYAKEDKAQTKVSSVNTLARNAFFVDEGELYISNVLMFLNTSNDGVLRIYFPKNNFKQITIKVYEGDENDLSLKVTQVTAETLNVIDVANLKYKFSIDNPNGKVFFELEENDAELEATQAVMLQTISNPNKNNQSYASRFENPTTISGVENSGIEVSPGYNQGEEYTETTPADHTLVYNVYVAGVGTRTVVLEFENTKTA